MASVRKTPSGSYELTLTHKLLPKRTYLTFPSEDEASAYGLEAEKWLNAGMVPAALAGADAPVEALRMSVLIQRWRNDERLSKTDDVLLGSLNFGKMAVTDLTYPWCENWVRELKVTRNLAPSTIRQRVQAVSRAIDWHIRSGANVVNPLKLLPRGYAVYSEGEARQLQAKGLAAKDDVVRDRRLQPGEELTIRGVLSGEIRKGQRAFGGDLSLLFELILQTGVRLREAYTIRKEDIDLPNHVLTIKTTKQRNGKVVYRQVPMRPVLHKALVEVSGTGLLFDFWDGDPKTLTKATTRLSQRFGNLFRYAGCEGLIEHDLRHEATCRWFEQRTTDGQWMFRKAEINKIMGWSGTSAMAQRYASFRVESLAARLWA
jgi:integrase